MLMVDLFSGLKGASQYALDQGWEVVTVDIEDNFQPDDLFLLHRAHNPGWCIRPESHTFPLFPSKSQGGRRI